MSSEALARFWRKAESDAKLQREIDGLFRRSGGRRVATGASIVDLAAKHGFKFTKDELKAHLAATGGEAELSEAEMEAAAGGIISAFLKAFDQSFKSGDGIVSF